MAPVPVEYRGRSNKGSSRAHSQHSAHSTALCHTPAHTTCISSKHPITQYHLQHISHTASSASMIVHHPCKDAEKSCTCFDSPLMDMLVSSTYVRHLIAD